MSTKALNISNFSKVYDFNNSIKKEENKEANIEGSGRSTYNSTKKITKQISLFNNNNPNNIHKNHSSINITKIKKFSKFKIDKNDNSPKKLIGKSSTSKLLLILKKAHKCKISPKEKDKKIYKTEYNLKNKKSENDDIKDKNTEKEIKLKKLRYDYFGNLIKKENKKIIHIIFKDQLNGQFLTEEIQIESFKKFNYIGDSQKDDIYNPNNNSFNKCCISF